LNVDRTPSAILKYFDEHHRPLFRFAWHLTGSVADAEDIVQECFLALLSPSCSFDPSRTDLRTYLFGAVRNQALKRFAAATSAAEPLDASTPERECLTAELQRLVQRAILRLPEGQREVLVLAHFEQMQLAEIAEILEIAIGAVKSRLQRARATLRELLSAYATNQERRS
jgi:RNA polymerase sigma-70 factor (ECF subfamily)